MKKQFFYGLVGFMSLAIVTLSSFTFPQDFSANTLQKEGGVAAEEVSRCSEYYKTWSSFSECYKTSVGEEEASNQQMAVLEKF